MDLKIILSVLCYVTNAPFFWASMGMTTAISMFIGAMIYNGDLTQVKKGIVSLLSYVLILFQVSVTRVLNTYSDPIRSVPQSQHPEMAYATMTTILFLTFFWGLGLVIGVFVLNHIKNTKKKLVL